MNPGCGRLSSRSDERRLAGTSNQPRESLDARWVAPEIVLENSWPTNGMFIRYGTPWRVSFLRVLRRPPSAMA